MLQACGYHFQNRQPETVLKLFWSFSSLTTQDSYELAWDVCLDLYYTWTPIKQTTATMALASVQVVMYLSGINPEAVGMDDDFYKRFRTSRLQLLGTRHFSFSVPSLFQLLKPSSLTFPRAFQKLSWIYWISTRSTAAKRAWARSRPLSTLSPSPSSSTGKLRPRICLATATGRPRRSLN